MITQDEDCFISWLFFLGGVCLLRSFWSVGIVLPRCLVFFCSYKEKGRISGRDCSVRGVCGRNGKYFSLSLILESTSLFKKVLPDFLAMASAVLFALSEISNMPT